MTYGIFFLSGSVNGKQIIWFQRLKNWEIRERKKAREYEKEAEREEERRREMVRGSLFFAVLLFNAQMAESLCWYTRVSCSGSSSSRNIFVT